MNLKPQRRILYGPWYILTKLTNILCSDGVQRVFTPVGQADTFWTQPGRVQVKGKTVTGFMSRDSDKEAWIFTAYSYRKNGYLLP